MYPKYNLLALFSVCNSIHFTHIYCLVNMFHKGRKDRKLQLILCVCHAKSLQSCLTLRPYGLQPARLLCPWDSHGKNTGVGCHALLQGIFITQGSNARLLHCRQILYCLSHQGSPLTLDNQGNPQNCHF